MRGEVWRSQKAGVGDRQRRLYARTLRSQREDHLQGEPNLLPLGRALGRRRRLARDGGRGRRTGRLSDGPARLWQLASVDRPTAGSRVAEEKPIATRV